MAVPAPIYKVPHAVIARLASMGQGLTSEILRESAARGIAARHRSTPLHPPAFAGWMQYGEIHHALRELLLPHGWRKDDTGMFSTVRSPNGRTAIAVTAGDDRTGRDGYPFPRSVRPRGIFTHLAIRSNQLGLELYGDKTGAVIEPDSHEPRITWFLLTHIRPDEVRIELSCPDAVDDSEPIVTETTLPMIPDEPDDDAIDVPVRRIS